MNKFYALGSIILIASVMTLTGCGPTPMENIDGPEDVKGRSKMPEHLKDCSFDRVGFQKSQGWDVIYVMRCPNSTTTTQRTVSAGKTTYDQNVTVIDGVEYTPMKGKKIVLIDGVDYISKDSGVAR